LLVLPGPRGRLDRHGSASALLAGVTIITEHTYIQPVATIAERAKAGRKQPVIRSVVMKRKQINMYVHYTLHSHAPALRLVDLAVARTGTRYLMRMGTAAGAQHGLALGGKDGNTTGQHPS
jgi:hypothetical protein